MASLFSPPWGAKSYPLDWVGGAKDRVSRSYSSNRCASYVLPRWNPGNIPRLWSHNLLHLFIIKGHSVLFNSIFFVLALEQVMR